MIGKRPTHDKLPSCYGEYNPDDPLCRLECYWSRSCCNRAAVGGILVPLRNDQYPGAG